MADYITERGAKIIGNNIYNIYENYVVGYATNGGHFFIIDKEDYDLVRKYTWWREPSGYFSANAKDGTNKRFRLHRLVMCGTEPCPYDIDHINTLEKWDNRKSNLRFATKTENMRNSKKGKNNNSGFIGVYWSKKDQSWYSQINLQTRTIHIRYASDKESAIKDRLTAEYILFGKEFAPQRNLFDEYNITEDVNSPNNEIYNILHKKCGINS